MFAQPAQNSTASTEAQNTGNACQRGRLKAAAACFIALGALWLTSCAGNPPKDIRNLCGLFEDRPGWYKDAKKSIGKWGVPIHVQMAIIYQESRFRDDALPPRRWMLGFIPRGRASSAYGYGQVKDDTWDWYIQKTGNRGADRDDFGDTVDFIGWYGSYSHKRLGISKWDAYNQYLAYHEGHGGFESGGLPQESLVGKRRPQG